MTRREWTVTVAALAIVAGLAWANVEADSHRRTRCHSNLTCDGSDSCWAMDGAFECARTVRRIDARGAYCLDVAGALGCYATVTDCQVARGVVVHVGGAAGECLPAPYPSNKGAKP